MPPIVPSRQELTSRQPRARGVRRVGHPADLHPVELLPMWNHCRELAERLNTGELNMRTKSNDELSERLAGGGRSA